jgi:hypothetical protein
VATRFDIGERFPHNLDKRAITKGKLQDMAPQYSRNYYDNAVLVKEAAAVSREKCIALIRQHLYNHLKHNPNSSYESWIASCHPENVQGVALDPRFLTKENNPWREVWENRIIFHKPRKCTRSKNKVDQFVDDFFAKIFR